jgi:2-amino-4-hydroxy-6-hydroxymethyldihydropteridine diphosphokinase
MARNAWESGTQPLFLYAIGIGSNRPLSGQLGPRAIVHAAMTALDLPPLSVVARGPVIATRSIGPALRSYANSAVIVASPLPPDVMLARLQALETRFHRRRYRRWGDRTLDLDLLLWSGGAVSSRHLTIPHKLFRTRDFVLRPLAAIAPRWRDPVTGLSVRQLAARLASPRHVDREHPRH